MPKSQGQLTLADLEEHSVWTFVDPADPKRLVEPSKKRGVAPLLSLVKTQYKTASGREFIGFGLITKTALVAPVIVTESGQVPLYLAHSSPPQRMELDDSYQKLGLSADSVFPISIAVVPKVRNAPISNEIEGFIYRDESGFHTIR